MDTERKRKTETREQAWQSGRYYEARRIARLVLRELQQVKQTDSAEKQAA